MAHPELGQRLLSRVIEDLTDPGVVEHNPRQEGRFLTTVVAPRSRGGAKPRLKAELDGDAQGSAPEKPEGAGEPDVAREET
jgi:hypothetical protein